MPDHHFLTLSPRLPVTSLTCRVDLSSPRQTLLLFSPRLSPLPSELAPELVGSSEVSFATHIQINACCAMCSASAAPNTQVMSKQASTRCVLGCSKSVGSKNSEKACS